MKLEASLKSQASFYNENIKWKRFERAAKYVPRKDRPAFLKMQEADRELLDVTDVDVMDVSLDEGDITKGKVLVWYTYYKLPDNRLKKTLFEQSWNYDGEKDWWYVDYESTRPASSEKLE